jgi:protein-tyrosine-phosphatase
MAEGALKKLFENRGVDYINVYSSGTAAATGFPATEYAAEAVKIWKADISGHQSQPLTEELIKNSDIILALAPSHCHEVIRIDAGARQKTFLLKNFPEPGCKGEGVEDPIGGSLDMYNKTFLEIGEELGRIMDDLIELASREKSRDEKGV